MPTSISRRRYLQWTLGSLAAAAVPACSGRQAVPEKGSKDSRMKMSLSARVAESPSKKDETTMSFEELTRVAKTLGYEALCMRASQLGVESPATEIQAARQKVDAAGLRVSMVTGDFAVPRNDEHGPDGLRNITPYLDLAEALGSDLIRICMKKEDDIAWAQKAADEARERGIRLAHQAHNSSLFETVDGSVRVLQAVGRDNFGIIYEPANWMIAGQDYGRAGIKQIAPWLFNVYVQNCRLHPEGKSGSNTWTRGRVPFDPIGLWDEGGVDFEEVFDALQEVGYQGYVTVHQAFAGFMSPAEAARRSYEYLKPLTGAV